MTVRAKLQLSSRTTYANTTAETFTFYPVQDNSTEENRKFSRYTPSGELRLYVDNPPVQEQFKVGNFYYVDFTPETTNKATA